MSSPLIALVAATVSWKPGELFNFLTTSVPRGTLGMRTPCNPFLPHTCSVFLTVSGTTEPQIAGSQEVLPRTG